ncbi:MAG: response regulator [Candidatus Neomarinimicrobiota bacterium]
MYKEDKNIQRVLVVDDERDIRNLIRYHLEKNGYEVLSESAGESGMKTAIAKSPHLVILDLMLPKIDGLEVCRLLKANEQTVDIPIIMVTARGEEFDVVKGLEYGADDYVTKPFSPKVLMARVKSVLRRRSIGEAGSEDDIMIGKLSIHMGRREVKVNSNVVDLTYSEFEILHLMARRQGWVFTRNQIIDQVHGGDYPVTDRSVDVQIVGLRKKLGNTGKYIKTVRGVGYRFKSNEK